MNTKLPTTTCHSELVEESHSLITPFANWLINKLTHRLTLSCFLILFSCISFAQDYEWQWAMNGGSSIGGSVTEGRKEQIYDVKVGSDGNYYFIASIYGSGETFNAQIGGEPVYPNNHPSNLAGGAEDIFLFSTDCEGQVRWSQAIGGGSQDMSFNLVLDSEDNVYIGGSFDHGMNNSAGTFPVVFGPGDTLPTTGSSNVPSDYWKRIFLIKYDKDGNYQGKKALQGNVDLSNNAAQILDLVISNDTLHFVVGLQKGTHLDNNVTVPNTVNAYQYYLAKYDTDLNYVSSMLLPIPDGTGFFIGVTRFVYDTSNDTYYIAGERRGAPLVPLTYDGQAIVNRAYIIAIDGSDGSKKWIREIYSNPGEGSNLTGNKISSVVIDDDSNVYIGGCRFRHPLYPDLKIYDPAAPDETTYNITTGADFTVPMIVKFNDDGDVQWVQAMTEIEHLAPSLMNGKGIAINGNEVAFGAQASAGAWGNIEIDLPENNYQPDPILVRLNRESGEVTDVHVIEGEPMSSKRMTAVAVDNDGNYIVGGSFDANLFMNNNLGISPLYTTGEADFFVAKLANSQCGTGASTEEFNGLKINVYPNPTTDIVYFETEEKLITYSVFNQNAQQVQVQTQVNETNYQMSLDGLASGTYFILLKTETGKSTTVKVVKE